MADPSIGNFPPTTADFLPQYKAIGQSLKKRFFRKPNVAEAVEQYEALGKELEREEQKTFAAVCYLEAAKCQETLKNYVPQANLLVKGGKLFLDAWEFENNFTSEETQTKDTSHLFGNLEVGIQTLNQASKSFSSQGYKGTAFVMNLQIGDTLYKNGSYGEALNHFKNALVEAKQHFSFIDQLTVTERVCKAKIKMMEYESVQKTVNDTLIAIKNHQSESDTPSTVLTSYAQQFEMMKVMLALILGGSNTDLMEFIWPKLPCSSTLHTGGDGDFSSPSPVPYEISSSEPPQKVEVTCLLKSLALAVQEGSTEDLKRIRNRLIPFMNEAHHDLMEFLLQIQS